VFVTHMNRLQVMLSLLTLACLI